MVDIPKDVQFKKGTYVGPDSVRHRTYKPKTDPDLGAIVKAIEMMADGEEAAVLHRRRHHQFRAGGEQAAARAGRRSPAFPITSTLMGLGAFPASDPQWLGLLGMHGTYEANHAMHDCDLMICLGARFDDRVTGKIDALLARARRRSISISMPSQINKNVRVDLPIVADAAKALKEMLHFWKTQQAQGRRARR